MAATFLPLASGSRGNACLLHADEAGLLIDAGLPARVLAGRLASVGRSWRDVHAVALTHTHGDHWNEAAFANVAKLGLPLHCHASHAVWLATRSAAFVALQARGLVQVYAAGVPFAVGRALVATALPVSHDSPETFAFRFEAAPTLFGPSWSLGYAADLGIWDAALVEAFADIDVLAVEFNHDEQMQRTSRRSWPLIQRVLGPGGHLSNRQAVEFLDALVGDGLAPRLQTVVALHLSQECNRVPLVAATGSDALARLASSAEFVIATQEVASVPVMLGRTQRTAARRRSPRRRFETPGLYDECA